MHVLKTVTVAVLGNAVWMVPGPAGAQFWSALDTVPDPNLVIGLDTSVTMGIRSDCSSCHEDGLPHAETRLGQVREEINETLPLFQNYFTVGGFEYEGCDYAKIRQRIPPNLDPTAVPSSYDATRAMISNATACDDRESRFPPPSTGNGCLTPSPLCADDVAKLNEIRDLLAAGTLPGLTGVTSPVVSIGTHVEPCPTGNPGPSLLLQTVLLNALGTASFSWPNYTVPPGPTPLDVQEGLCRQLETAFNSVRNSLETCSPGVTAAGSSVWDMTFLDAGITGWCDSVGLSGYICSGGDVFDGTCVCDASDQENCGGSGAPPSECGNLMFINSAGHPGARQQVAICELYSPVNGSIGDVLRSQPDNLSANPGPRDPTDSHCRENVAVLVTDGYNADVPSIPVEALGAIPLYESWDRLSNIFVVRPTDLPQFKPQADLLASELSRGAMSTSLDGSTRDELQSSFARVLNRVYQGAYTGGNLATDFNQTRAVLHSFTVPGFAAGGSGPYPPPACTDNRSSGSPYLTCVTDDYIGFPSRLSVYEIDADGQIQATPRYESDWQSRVDANACPGGPVTPPTSLDPNSESGLEPLTQTSSPPPPIPSSPTYEELVGPSSRFANGVLRDARLSQADRDGDGVPESAPPGAISYQYGHSFGFATTTPVVVERPRDAQAFPTARARLAYTAFINDVAVRERPRVIYYMDGGYVLGIHGGDYAPAPTSTYGSLQLSADYDDSRAPAGGTVLRYLPSFVNDPGFTKYDLRENPLIPQPLTTGQLRVKDIYVDPVRDPAGNVNGSYYTVLVGNQGKEGRGYFMLDISRPCNAPAFAAEVRLPGAKFASAPAAVHAFRMPTGELRNVVIAVSGLDADDSRIYAYDLLDGSPIESYSLPGAANEYYASEPVCLEEGGAVQACYALRTDGYLVRIDVRTAPTGGARFYRHQPMNAENGGQPWQGGDRRYYTAPAVYYDTKGYVNLVFGSGDYRNLTGEDADNSVFRVKDVSLRDAVSPENPAVVDTVCADSAGSQRGEFPVNGTFGSTTITNGRVLSPPMVADGVVSWTVYDGGITGCIAGQSYVFAMDFDTCQDVLSPGARPGGVEAGAGMPTTPVLHRQSDRLLVQTSAAPTSGQVDQTNRPTTRSGQVPTYAKPLFWRPELPNF